MFKNNKLRLLMTLVWFQRLGLDDDMDVSWIIPSSVTSTQLSEALESIKRYEATPPVFEGGQTAEDFIRRKPTARPRVAHDDDDSDEGAASEGDGDFQFPAGGPTIRKSDALEELTASRRRKRKDGEALTDAEREARRKARQENNAKMQRKIKSALYVHDSDDEDNEERDRDFFAREEERRRNQGQRLLEALSNDPTLDEMDPEPSNSHVRKGQGKKKRGSKAQAVPATKQKRRKTSHSTSDEIDEDMPDPASDVSSPETPLSGDEENEPSDTPISSPHQHQSSGGVSSQRRSISPLPIGELEEDPQIRRFLANKASNARQEMDGDGDGDDQPVALPIRRARTRGGFVIDSDSE